MAEHRAMSMHLCTHAVLGLVADVSTVRDVVGGVLVDDVGDVLALLVEHVREVRR